LKNLGAKEESKNNQEAVEELQEKLENLSLRIVPKNQRKSKGSNIPIDLTNEKGII